MDTVVNVDTEHNKLQQYNHSNSNNEFKQALLKASLLVMVNGIKNS